VDQSEVLPDSVLFRENSEPDYYWLPSHTIDIIQSRKRDTIFLYEKARPEYGYDYNIMIWHEGNPRPLTLELTNL
jgi:hypothetical protein